MFISYCVLYSSCPQSLQPECGNMFHILYCGLFCVQLYVLLLLCALCRPDQPQSSLKMRRIQRRRRKKRKRRISASRVHLMWSWWLSHPHLSYQVNHKVTVGQRWGLRLVLWCFQLGQALTQTQVWILGNAVNLVPIYHYHLVRSYTPVTFNCSFASVWKILLTEVHLDTLLDISAFDSFLTSLVRQEMSQMPRGVYFSALRGGNLRSDQGKTVAGIPSFMLKTYEKNKQPGLKPGLAGDNMLYFYLIALWKYHCSVTLHYCRGVKVITIIVSIYVLNKDSASVNNIIILHRTGGWYK